MCGLSWKQQGLIRGRCMMEKQRSRVTQEIDQGSALGCGTLYLNLRTEEVTLLGAGEVIIPLLGGSRPR